MIYFSEASKYLIEVFTHVEESERDEILDKMIEIIQKQPCKCQLKDIFTRTCDLTIGNFGLKDKNTQGYLNIAIHVHMYKLLL